MYTSSFSIKKNYARFLQTTCHIPCNLRCVIFFCCSEVTEFIRTGRGGGQVGRMQKRTRTGTTQETPDTPLTLSTDTLIKRLSASRTGEIARSPLPQIFHLNRKPCKFTSVALNRFCCSEPLVLKLCSCVHSSNRCLI